MENRKIDGNKLMRVIDGVLAEYYFMTVVGQISSNSMPGDFSFPNPKKMEPYVLSVMRQSDFDSWIRNFVKGNDLDETVQYTSTVSGYLIRGAHRLAGVSSPREEEGDPAGPPPSCMLLLDKDKICRRIIEARDKWKEIYPF